MLIHFIHHCRRWCFCIRCHLYRDVMC